MKIRCVFFSSSYTFVCLVGSGLALSMKLTRREVLSIPDLHLIVSEKTVSYCLCFLCFLNIISFPLSDYACYHLFPSGKMYDC